MKKTILMGIISLLFTVNLMAQHKRSNIIKETDRFGFSAMSYLNYADWAQGNNKTNIKFDHFGIWAQTDLSKTFFAGIQYRFYEDWRTPGYAHVGWNINKDNTLKIGQIWVPFGFEYQPYDDWGNQAYYMGFQDDYDYGLSWKGNFGISTIYASYFMNQQLSSSSSMRLDADVYSGDESPNNLFAIAKKNEEANQVNLMFEVKPSGNNWDITVGISGMAGQLYNKTTEKFGSRFAGEVHFGINRKRFHFNIQETLYKYKQMLPDSATQDMKDFINMSSWNFAYEMPSEASLLTASAAYDAIDKKLTPYVSYSYVSGGTTQASSQLLIAGVSSSWQLVQIYGEVHYGVNDPQLSGKASGYGRNAGAYDLGFQIRVYYSMSILNEKNIKKIQ